MKQWRCAWDETKWEFDWCVLVDWWWKVIYLGRGYSRSIADRCWRNSDNWILTTSFVEKEKSFLENKRNHCFTFCFKTIFWIWYPVLLVCKHAIFSAHFSALFERHSVPATECGGELPHVPSPGLTAASSQDYARCGQSQMPAVWTTSLQSTKIKTQMQRRGNSGDLQLLSKMCQIRRRVLPWKVELFRRLWRGFWMRVVWRYAGWTRRGAWSCPRDLPKK